MNASDAHTDALASARTSFPAKLLHEGGHRWSYRELGDANASCVVLVHGLGSSSLSWSGVAQELAGRHRVIAWDTPGAGNSAALTTQAATAHDYAASLKAFLQALRLPSYSIVSLSLGALIAAPLVQSCTYELRQLVLIGPATGYGDVERHATGQQFYAAREHDVSQLSMAEIAQLGAARSLSANANDEAQAFYLAIASQAAPGAYLQSLHALCNSSLMDLLPTPLQMPCAVACGSADLITPPHECALVAHRCGVALHQFDGLGHSCHIERPSIVSAWLAEQLV